ncbi:MAG TPA: hypothetical protein VE007_02895 [Thermoanaerobaculia bacterium]|nr:hypothetical protein [Thermoanaerobaculia bacterium]
MKIRVALTLSVLLAASSALAQMASSGLTDIYQVYVVKAAPGKATELLKALKNPPAGTAMPTHALILRHLQGDDWDFAVIQHVGNKFTLEASATPFAPERELRAWHADTFAQGPPWPEFAKAMGIGQPQAGAAPTAKDVYILSEYRGSAGHRAQLEDTLKRIVASSVSPADNVILQHLDGSPWDYLHIARYTDWKSLAAEQDDPGAGARARKAGMAQDPGLVLREHMASHHDTIADRIAVQASK